MPKYGDLNNKDQDTCVNNSQNSYNTSQVARELQLYYYVHFWTNTLEKGMTPPLISPAYGFNSILVLLQGWFCFNQLLIFLLSMPVPYSLPKICIFTKPLHSGRI